MIMKALRTMLLSLAFVAMSGSLALAQQTGAAGPMGGTGTNGPGGVSAPGAVDPNLDLPLDKPDYHPPAPAATPNPNPNPSMTPKPPVQNPPVNPTNPPQNPTDNGDNPPQIYGHDQKSPNQTIFYVIDISGSMGWDMGQYTTPDGHTANGCRLDRAKAELIKSVMSLPSNFKFNMLAYDCSVFQWSPGMVPADDANKQAACAWINTLQPEDATGTGPGVSSALGDKSNMLVVLLTDGAPNCGAGDESGDSGCIQAHRQMIRANNTQNAVINVFAIGATDEFEAFCQNVAADNGGTCTDVH